MGVAPHTSRQWGSAGKNLLEKGLHEVTENYTALKFTTLATDSVLTLILWSVGGGEETRTHVRAHADM